MDGPWWLAVLLVVALAVLTFGNSPWKWVGVPVLVVFGSLPLCVRWISAIWQSVTAFREGLRS
jgi:hypothetical protein